MITNNADDRRLASLSVVLPCFNEVDNVAAAVEQAHEAAAAHAREHEVVVVDDGSTDGTGAVAAALVHADERVRLVTHEHNRGYGAALRSGFAATRGDWVLLTDGDLQFDLGELGRFTGLARDHDLVAGYRIDRADPPARRAAAHAWNLLVRHSFGVALRDVDCAFKLMRGDALRALPLVSDGAMISTELLVRAQLARWRLAEVGVHHRPRPAGEPSGGDPGVVLRAFREHRALSRALRDADRAPVPASGLAGRAPAT
jgi:glycosyltransferase involved in cell wall biosynthesis